MKDEMQIRRHKPHCFLSPSLHQRRCGMASRKFVHNPHCHTYVANFRDTKLAGLRKNSGFVSGHRFSDAANPSKSTAPFGAGPWNTPFGVAKKHCIS
jgi:hypothetical protein